jgi:hypothetical protein
MRGLICRLQLLLASPAQSFSGPRPAGFMSQIRDSPKLEGLVPVFISSRNSVVRLYPQALDYLIHCNSYQALLITFLHEPRRKHRPSIGVQLLHSCLLR